MSNPNTDHPTWVYHALHEAKIVKASEAKLLYKKGWRNSPDPKILYSGFYGKLFKFKLWLKDTNFYTSSPWFKSIIQAIIAGLIVSAVTVFYLQPLQSNSQPNDLEHKQ